MTGVHQYQNNMTEILQLNKRVGSTRVNIVGDTIRQDVRLSVTSALNEGGTQCTILFNDSVDLVVGDRVEIELGDYGPVNMTVTAINKTDLGLTHRKQITIEDDMYKLRTVIVNENFGSISVDALVKNMLNKCGILPVLVRVTPRVGVRRYSEAKYENRYVLDCISDIARENNCYFQFQNNNFVMTEYGRGSSVENFDSSKISLNTLTESENLNDVFNVVTIVGASSDDGPDEDVSFPNIDLLFIGYKKPRGSLIGTAQSGYFVYDLPASVARNQFDDDDVPEAPRVWIYGDLGTTRPNQLSSERMELPSHTTPEIQFSVQANTDAIYDPAGRRIYIRDKGDASNDWFTTTRNDGRPMYIDTPKLEKNLIAMVSDEESIRLYGRRETLIHKGQITRQKDLNNFAINYLTDHSKLKRTARFSTTRSIHVGDQITILGGNVLYTVDHVTYTQVGDDDVNNVQCSEHRQTTGLQHIYQRAQRATNLESTVYNESVLQVYLQHDETVASPDGGSVVSI